MLQTLQKNTIAPISPSEYQRLQYYTQCQNKMPSIPPPEYSHPQYYPQDYWNQHYCQTEQPENIRPTRIAAELYLIATSDQKHYQRYRQFVVAKKEHIIFIQSSQQKESHQITSISDFPDLHGQEHEKIEIQLNQLNGVLDIHQTGSTRLLINSRGIEECERDSMNQWQMINFINKVGCSAINKLVMHRDSSFALTIYGGNQNQILDQILVGMLFRSLNQMINKRFNDNFDVIIKMEKEEHEQMRGEYGGVPFSKSQYVTWCPKCRNKTIHLNDFSQIYDTSLQINYDERLPKLIMSESQHIQQEAEKTQNAHRLSKVQTSKLHQHSNHSSEYDAQEDMDLVNQDQIYTNKRNQKKQPIARKVARPYSEDIQVHSQPAGTKTKPKYDKKENQGNVLLEQARKNSILKELCDPNGIITVDSLGHALQKLQIGFDLRDVSDMIGLYWRLKGRQVPQNQEDRITQDENGEINLSVKLNSQQFKQLYKNIRKKK